MTGARFVTLIVVSSSFSVYKPHQSSSRGSDTPVIEIDAHTDELLSITGLTTIVTDKSNNDRY